MSGKLKVGDVPGLKSVAMDTAAPESMRARAGACLSRPRKSIVPGRRVATVDEPASAAIPFLLLHEYYPNVTPAGLLRKNWSVDAAGYASLPQGPGLGVEVDEKRLEEEAKKPQTYKWPGATLKDGSVSDY